MYVMFFQRGKFPQFFLLHNLHHVFQRDLKFPNPLVLHNACLSEWKGLQSFLCCTINATSFWLFFSSERTVKDEAAAATPQTASVEEETPKPPTRKGSSLRARMKERLAKAKVGPAFLCFYVSFSEKIDWWNGEVDSVPVKSCLTFSCCTRFSVIFLLECSEILFSHLGGCVCVCTGVCMCMCTQLSCIVPSSCILTSESSLYWQEEAEGEIEKEAREERDRQRTLRKQQSETKFDVVSYCSIYCATRGKSVQRVRVPRFQWLV